MNHALPACQNGWPFSDYWLATLTQARFSHREHPDKEINDPLETPARRLPARPAQQAPRSRGTLEARSNAVANLFAHR